MTRWLALLFLCASATPGATLQGVVADADHRPVIGATVRLQSKAVKTDAVGTFRFHDLQAGSYIIIVSGSSFGPYVVAEREVKRVELTVLTPAFSDEPSFVVAGVTAGTYQGGHGSDVVLRSSEDLARATALLSAAGTDVKSGNALEAVRAYQRAAELDPSERNLFEWGTELLNHRADQAALEVFTKGARLFPGSVRMLLGLAATEYSLGSYDPAMNTFFAACDLDPRDATPYLFLGKARSSVITKSAGYLERMRRFAELRPESSLANYFYAAALWAHRDDAVHIKALVQKAIELDPNLGGAYLLLGTVEAETRNFRDAIAALRKATEVSPELEEAHYRLAQVCRLTGHATEAQKELAQYDQLSKKSADEVQRQRRELQQFVIKLRTQ